MVIYDRESVVVGMLVDGWVNSVEGIGVGRSFGGC